MQNDKFVGLAPKYGGPDFWLHSCSSKAISEGQEEKGAVHVAFAGSSKKVVHQFYETALKAGARDNGPPGERSYTKGYYAAYVLDLDGNNIECVYYQPWWLTAMPTGPMVLGALAVAGVAWYGGQAGWRF